MRSFTRRSLVTSFSAPSSRAASLATLALTAMFLAAAPGCSGCGDDSSGTGGDGRLADASSSPSSTASGGEGDGGAGPGPASVSVASQSAASTGTGVVECAEPCEVGEICSHGTCIPGSECETDEECDFDTYCDEETGTCQPWTDTDPSHDDACVQLIAPGILAPAVRCQFSEAPDGDPFPGHVDVQGTPVVVNFNVPADSGSPSIAASFTATVPGGYTENLGVIRVLRGTDCTLEANLGGVDLDADGDADYTTSPASLAVADLDGDASAEIVAYIADGSTAAFTRKAGVWSVLWKEPQPIGAPWSCVEGDACSLAWAGTSIHDLDDDGVPEVIREGVVFDGVTGEVRSMQPPDYASYSVGLFPTLADLDGDGNVELSNGARIWEYIADAWVEEPGFFAAEPAKAPGFTAFADFGDFGTSGNPDDAEIVVIRSNNVYVYALDGTTVLGPIPVPSNGGGQPGGGPPTISDFDGDGLPEFGVAGRAFYTVYDVDCTATPRPGGACDLGPCDGDGTTCAADAGMLWSRRTQDLSSNITGSSIFDFEADGTSEVVYADECFTRVYNGQTGEVLFSQYSSSCTWYENPIVADVDGNFRADVVSPSNKACSADGTGIVCQPETLTAEGVDLQFNGLRCETNDDCTSNLCDEGLCRCAASAECCADGDDAACEEFGYRCAPPNPGTAGSGDTCRAYHPHGVSGIRVFSDVNDQWVRSRTIWSQHAYSVTHIGEDGVVPRTSEWTANWLAEDPELNNFRQNVPGSPNANAIPDTTAGASVFDGCDGTTAVLEIDICNRGAAPVGAGLEVSFSFEGDEICTAETTGPLDPEECESVSCEWTDPPSGEDQAVEVDVVVNAGGDVTECKSENNDGIIQGVFCPDDVPN